MSVVLGYFESAEVVYHNDTTRIYQFCRLDYVDNFITITHYVNRSPEPENKRTIFIPKDTLISFTGFGYAKALHELR